MKSVRSSVGSDWLREVRLERGLPSAPVAHQSLYSLLAKGSLLGIVLVLMPLMLLVLLNNRQSSLTAEVVALAPVEERLGDAQARLKSMASKRDLLKQQVEKIASQLVALRSSSALLEQMRQVTPKGVRLRAVAALPSKLTVTGEAEGSDAFQRINALALNLEAEQEFSLNGTSIVKATADDAGLIEFRLESVIDSTVATTPERLRELGSDGLAQRFELLRAKGVGL